MWIESVEIQGFGTLREVSLALDSGYQCLYGGNGVGKTTVLEFIRACLFGWHQRSQTQRFDVAGYPFLGGRLVLVVGGERFFLQRTTEGKSKGTVLFTDSSGQSLPETMLQQQLGNISRQLFEQVFAITIDDLNRIDLLAGDELRSHLYSIGLQTALQLRLLDKNLQQEREAIFRPNGTKPSLNRLSTERRLAQKNLQDARRQESKFRETQKRAGAVEAEIASITLRLTQLRTQVQEAERWEEAIPLWQEWKTLRGELAMDSSILEVEQEMKPHYPTAVISELQDLQRNIQQMEEELQSSDNSKAAMEKETDSLEDQYRHGLPQTLSTKTCVELRSYLTRWENAYENWRQKAQVRVWERWAPILVIVVLLIWWSVPNQEYRLLSSVVLGAASLSHFIAAFQQRRERRRALDQTFLAAADLEASWNDLEAWKERLTQRERVEQQLIWQRRELQRLETTCQKQRERLCRSRTIQAKWFDKLGVSTHHESVAVLEHLQTRSKKQKRCEELHLSLQLLLGNPPEELARLDPKVTSQLRANVEDCQLSLETRLEEKGHLRRQLEEIEQTRAVEHWEKELVQLREQAEPLLRRLAALTQLERSLHETRQYFETHEQPALLRRASYWLKRFTREHYESVIVPFDERRLLILDPNGLRWEPERLSRGTVEQLYLALRFSVIESYAERGVVLPVIFDEVTANFDPYRTESVQKGIMELAKTHQVIQLTCRELTVSESDGAESKVESLRRLIGLSESEGFFGKKKLQR